MRSNVSVIDVHVLSTGRQLTTFNHQGIIIIGGKADVSGRPVAANQGTIAGHCSFTRCAPVATLCKCPTMSNAHIPYRSTVSGFQLT